MYFSHFNFGEWGTLPTILLVISIVIGIVLFCTFLSRKNEEHFTGFPGKLYDFLTFNKLILSGIFRLFYLISAVFLTILSIVIIFVYSGNYALNVGVALALAVGGNILLRVVYELLLLGVLVCRNVIEINKKLSTETAAPQPQPRDPAIQTVPVPEPGAVVFCRNCGQPYDADASACPRCGTKRT